MKIDANKLPSNESYDKIKMFYRNKFVNRRESINCIFHLDDKKSLKVYGDRYNCLSCNHSGKTATLITWLQEYMGDKDEKD